MVEQKTQITGWRALRKEVEQWWKKETDPPNPVPFMVRVPWFDDTFWKRRRERMMLDSSTRTFAEHLPTGTSYDFAAIAIHNLHNSSSRVRMLRNGDKNLKLQQPPHGFTTYPLDQERVSSLPAPLLEFFGEEINQEGTRFNILTEVFRSERTEGGGPIPQGAIEVARELIGEDMNYIFQMFVKDKQFEIRVKRGGYYYGSCEDLFTSPNRSLKMRFLTAVNGKFKLDDPRSFEVENELLSPEQDKLLAGTLAFAVDERQRQLTLSPENSRIQTLASSAANRRRQLAT